MASRPRGYGMSAAANRKILEKYDPQQEEEARIWIEAVLGEKVFGGAEGPDDVQKVLKDGKILARLAIKLGAKIKVNEQNMPFKQMENIGNFLSHCGHLGVASGDQFQTADLYDNANMTSVISCIHAVGRKCQLIKDLDIPTLGPKEAEANVREFTEEQLRAGESILGMQAGPTQDQVASQSGDHYGRGRQITDQHK